ncbi:MAG: sulfotransferase [Candidatus Aminicenantes bacterium]
MQKEENQLIFVAGVPRSGTTLVQNILDCHPDIYGGPEFDRIPNIIDLRRKLHASIKWKRIDIFVTSAQVDTHIAALIKNLLFPVAQRNHCKYISEKTPWNILAFKDLIEILPQAKFIHIIRYPHAVIASMINVAKRAKREGVTPPDFTQSISLACYYIESVLKLIHHLDSKYPGKILTLKYEQLLEKPLSEIKRLCSFIGVPFNERMLKPGDINHPGQENMTQTGIWYTKSMYNSNFDKNNIHKWQTQLKGISKAFINYVFLNNANIKRYGYSFSNNGIPLICQWWGYYKYKKYLQTHDFSRIPFRTLG